MYQQMDALEEEDTSKIKRLHFCLVYFHPQISGMSSNRILSSDGESHGAGSGSPQREGCGPPTVVSLHLRNLNQ